MKTFIRIIIIGITGLFAYGCSIKTALHSYPEEYQRNFSDTLTTYSLQLRENGTYFSRQKGGDTTLTELYHNNQPLNIQGHLSKAPTWTKTDAIENPLNDKIYIYTARVGESRRTLENEYSLQIQEGSNSGEAIEYSMEGHPEDEFSLGIEGRLYTLRLKERWDNSYSKRNSRETTVINRYPAGSRWALMIGGQQFGEIIHGRYVEREESGKAGQLYTLQIRNDARIRHNSDLGLLLTGLTLIDRMYYYHSECDPSDSRLDRISCTEDLNYRFR